jgi:hypothetical protein
MKTAIPLILLGLLAAPQDTTWRITAQTKVQPPKAPAAHVTCDLHNHIYVLSHFDKSTGTLRDEEHDDWWVDCKIEQASKFYQKCDVGAVHPMEFREAMSAVEEFQKHTAPQLVKAKALTLDAVVKCRATD